MTAAGPAFLTMTRWPLTQADAAKKQPGGRSTAKPTFALGFLTGKEIDWCLKRCASFTMICPI